MNEVEKIELIEAYHYQRLRPEEQTLFEELLAVDNDFAAEVRAYDELLDGLDMLHIEDFEARLQAWEARYHTPNAQPELRIEKGGSFLSFTKRWYAAAALACCLFLPLAYYGIMHQTQHQRTFAAHFAPAPAIVMEAQRNSSAVDNGIEQLTKATHFYNDHRYSEALPLLEAYAQAHGKDVRLALYIGVCKLALEQTDAAVADLQWAAQSTDDNLAASRAEAQWTLALAYLRKGEIAPCKSLLQAIINEPNHNYQKQATQLLNEL